MGLSGLLDHLSFLLVNVLCLGLESVTKHSIFPFAYGEAVSKDGNAYQIFECQSNNVAKAKLYTGA